MSPEDDRSICKALRSNGQKIKSVDSLNELDTKARLGQARRDAPPEVHDIMTVSFRLSIAIPLHNEESVLPELLRRTRIVLDQMPGGPHEIVFVDDGSTDRTFAILEEAVEQDSRIQVISLSRNFGHQAAITAAMDHVTGEAAVVMDGDLQDVPEMIPQFVEKYQQGYDVVYAQRVRRKETWPLRICYFVFYRMMRKLSDIRLPLDSGDFGLMSRRVIDQVRRMPEHHRYLRGLRSWVGFRQTGLTVERAERHSGKSKYSVMRLMKLATDGIFAFSIVPIRAAALFGGFVMFLSSLYVLYALYAKIFLQKSPQGFTALLVAVTFLSGIVLFFLGVIGEYVGRIYEETKARPQYIIGRIVGNLKAETERYANQNQPPAKSSSAGSIG
jgi:polyisoprenyl-phosphate glycosyltransferase